MTRITLHSAGSSLGDVQPGPPAELTWPLTPRGSRPEAGRQTVAQPGGVGR